MKGLNGVKFLPLLALLIFMTVGCSSGGYDGIDGTGMRGTAAEGEPLANAEVIIRDVNGNTLSTTTNAQGKYNFNNIGKKGDGVGYYDKFIIYVSGAVKGSTVKVKIEKISGTVAFGELIKT